LAAGASPFDKVAPLAMAFSWPRDGTPHTSNNNVNTIFEYRIDSTRLVRFMAYPGMMEIASAREDCTQTAIEQMSGIAPKRLSFN
jgi:hypothetical protein